MILSTAVLLYQLFFVAVMYIASRFGRIPMIVALIASLLWTATHVFMPPLAVLQATVIVGSYFVFRRRFQKVEGEDAGSAS